MSHKKGHYQTLLCGSKEKNGNWKGGISKNKEYQRKRQNERNKRFRLEILQYYGGNPPECNCCGEKIIEFLCLDHIRGGGTKHRKENGGGGAIYWWIKRNKFPEGFQVLCHNCNQAKGYYGKCPHKML